MAQELDEILLGFVEEMEEYIPALKEGAAELQAHPDNRPVLDEMRRLVHIVRGAAAMLGVNPLSQVARSMELAIEEVREGRAELGDQLLARLLDTASTFSRYADHLKAGGAPDDATLKEAADQLIARIDALSGSGVGEQETGIDSDAADALFAESEAASASAPSMTPSGIELDEELLDSFNEEVEEHFTDISKALHGLGTQVEASTPVKGEVSELLRAIRRSVHTVKGASAVLGLQHIADVGHRIEDVLDWFYESAPEIDPDQVAVLGQVLDQFENLVRQPDSYDAELVDGCLQLLQEKMGEAGTATAPDAASSLLDEADGLLGEESASLLDEGDSLLNADSAPVADAADELFAEAEAASDSADALFAESEAASVSAPSLTPSGIELDEELLASFNEEVEEHFTDISKALHGLGTQVEASTPVKGEVSELLRGIRRSVHTVKGASAVLGLQHIADVGHRIEDVLDWFYESAPEIDPDQVAVLGQVLDQFENLVRQPDSYEAAIVDEGLARLQEKMGEAGTATAPDAASSLLDDADGLLGEESASLLDAGDSLLNADSAPVADAADDLFAEAEAASASAPSLTPSGIELDEELLASFNEEVEEHFTDISTALHGLETQVEAVTPVKGEVSELLRGIRRSVHTVKGASAVLGLQHIADVGHRIEDVLDWFYESAPEIDPDQVAVLGQVLDQFENLVRQPDSYDAELVDGCLQLLQEKMGESGAAAVAAPDTASTLLDDADGLLGEESDSLLDAGDSLLNADSAPVADAADELFAESEAASASAPSMTPSGIELDEELLASFNEEVEEHFTDISKALHGLGTQVEASTPVKGEVSELLRGIRRSVHTVKGASAVLGLQHIADVGHRIEDVLDWFYESAPEIGPDQVAVLGQVLDQFETLVRQPDSYEAAIVDAGLAHLQEGMTGTSIPKAAPAPAVAPEALEEDTGVPADAGSTASTAMFSAEELQMLREGFMEEADEHLQELSRSMQSLEGRVTETLPMDEALREEVRTIRRAVHTIKGASAVIGITDISSYAHKVEDFLDWLFEKAQEITPDQVSLLAESVDLLGSIVEDPASVEAGRQQDIFVRLAEASGEASPPLTAQTAGKEEKVGTDEEPPQLSEPELALLRRNFADNADVYVANLHQSVQRLNTMIADRIPLSGEAAEELAKILEQVQALRRDALILGNGDVSAYTGKVVGVLQWVQAKTLPVNAALTDALGDAVDVLGLLLEDPELVNWDRIDNACDKLEAIKPPERLAKQAVSRVTQSAEPPKKTGAAATQEPTKAEPAAVKLPGERRAHLKQQAAPPQETPAAASEAAKTIRIQQSQLDKFINLANELLVGVSGFERNMGLFQGALEELDLTVRRLKDIALELETKFEVKALDQLSFHFDRLEQTRQEIQGDTSLAEFDAMELDHYTQLNLIIRALNESAVDVASLHTNLETIHSGLGVDINRQHRVVRELQVQMMHARLCPMSILTPRLSRTMRDAAVKLQKRVRLTMEGDTVELDRVIWEKLADPFMHLVRNSVDHGIESPVEREAKGKPSIATIRIAGAREGHHVVVRYSDDGKGININSIRDKARQTVGDAVDSMDEKELIELIFSPGFSTQKVVTQISGRGVGMDVVKQNVHDLQGTIAVDTQPGQGTTFTIRVPLTLGVVRALLVEFEGVTYGIALNEILDIHRIDAASIAPDGHSFLREGRQTPLYNLPLLLRRQVVLEEQENVQPLVFTIAVEGELAGIRIPHITGQKEVVLKGLGNHLRAVTGIAGAAVMGDGTVIPLLNMAELLTAYRQQEQPELEVRKEAKPKTLTVMIVDDSISIRRVMSRLVTSHGWVPVEAKDGQDAFEQLDAVQPDCILLDVEMPRMNGFEFLALKANLQDHKDIPVIMLTSRTSDKHRNKAMELGASVFLNKPPKDEDFVNAVLRLTGHQRSESSTRQREAVQ